MAPDGRLGALGGSTTKPVEIAMQNESGDWTAVKKSSSLSLEEDTLSLAQVIKYPSKNGRHSYMFFYPPKMLNLRPVDGELPPLLVKTHG